MGDITVTILTEIADEKGVDPLDLEPLYTSVDPDTLQALYKPPTDVTKVEFEYSGYKVTIKEGNQVHLEST